MKRWALRIFITLIVLLLAAVAAVEIVLRTSYPKRFLLAQLETTLQLKCTAASVHTGIFGGTTFNDVTLSLPLASEAFLQVKTLRVHHTSLPSLLFGRDLVIDSLEFDDPQLKVHEDGDGRWNVVEVTDLLQRAAGGTQMPVATNHEVPRIPKIILSNGTVLITDRIGRSATLHPVDLQGSPQGPLLWRCQGTIGHPDASQLFLTAEIVPGNGWQHRVSIDVQHGAQWLTPWLNNNEAQQFINQSDIQAVWQGALGASGINGTLNLRKFDSQGVSASGAINVALQSSSITAQPIALKILGLAGVPHGMELRSGQLSLDSGSVRSQDLIATVAGGDVKINGEYAWLAGSADASIGWHNLQYPEQAMQNGSLDFKMRTNWPNIIRVDTHLTSSGNMPAVSWNSQLSLTGAGNTLQSIKWELTADKLNVMYPKLNTNLDHLTAKFTNTPKQLTLTELSIPAGPFMEDRPRGTMTGHGFYRWPDEHSPRGGNWKLAISGEGWPVFVKRQTTADFNLDMAGDVNEDGKEWARLNNLDLRASTGVRFQVKGGIYYNTPGMPVNLVALGQYPPFMFEGYAHEEALRGGEFKSQLQITGKLRPLNLQISGGLKGLALRVGERPVGDVSMALRGEAIGDDSGEYSIHLVTQHLRLFEGDWDLDGRYTSSDERAVFDAKLAQMPLSAADDLINPPPKLTGVMSAEGRIVLPGLVLKDGTIDATFQINDVRSRRFSADQIAGELHTNPQHILINHMKATRKTGGEINMDIDLPIATPQNPQVTFNASGWPIDIPRGSCLVDARTTAPLLVDIPSRSASGPFELAVYPRYRDVEYGPVRASGSLDGRRIILDQIDGDEFGGTLTGNASYDLDHLVNTKVSLSWRDVDSAKVENLWSSPVPTTTSTTNPGTNPTTNPDAVIGNIAGSLRIGPPTDPRPLAPLAMELKCTSDQLHWRTINLTDVDLKGYFDPGTQAGEERLIFDDSSLHLAGGAVQVFLRLTRHPLGPIAQSRGEKAFIWSFDSVVNAKNLDLNALIHAGDPAAADQPGLVAMHTTLLGNPYDRNRWIGDGTFSLTKSDLAGNTIFQALYSLMSVQLGKKPPSGVGNAIVHFEGENLDVASLYYSNRGIEAQGNGTILDVWKGPSAKLHGYMIGTVHPLRDLKLPFAADVDKVLAAVQQSATPIKVGGTLAKPEPQPTLFADIGEAFKALLVGEAHGD